MVVDSPGSVGGHLKEPGLGVSLPCAHGVRAEALTPWNSDFQRAETEAVVAGEQAPELLELGGGVAKGITDLLG